MEQELFKAKAGTRINGYKPVTNIFSMKIRRRFWEQLPSGNNGGKRS